MSMFQAFVLGVVQGLTEFLPISSSGHLIIIPNLFGWQPQPLVFDVFLHLGTAGALVVYFWNDLLRILKAVLFDRRSNEAKLGLYIVIATIPAVVIGFFMVDTIEYLFRNLLYVTVLLMFGSFLMVYAEIRTVRRELFNKDENTSNDVIDKISLIKAFIIGLFQSLALFPGVSRSGSTISGGMILGLNREQAARFSFLMSVPVVIGAVIFKISGSVDVDLYKAGFTPLVIGFASSFFVGLVAIRFLLDFLKTRSLYLFVAYRILLVFFLVLFIMNLF